MKFNAFTSPSKVSFVIQCFCVSFQSISDIVHNVPKLNIYEQTLGQQVEMFLYIHVCVSISIRVCFVDWRWKGVHFGCARSSIGKYLVCIAFFYTNMGKSATKNVRQTKEEKSQQHIMELCVTDCAWMLVCVFVYYFVRYNSIESPIWIDSLQLIHVSFETITYFEMVGTPNALAKNCFASSISKLFSSNQKWAKRKINETSIWKMQISRIRI